MRLIFLSYLLFLAAMAVMPLNQVSDVTLNHVHVFAIRLDHLLHSILYIPWAFLYIITFRPCNPLQKFILVASGLLMAFATEGVQYFLTYRSFTIPDMLSNFFGVLLGCMVLFLYFRK